MKSPDWSHVANPSRCQFCRSEYHLSSDELYPEHGSLQLALTQFPRNDRPIYRGHEDVIIGSSSQVQGQMDAIHWWAGGEDCWWMDSTAATTGVHCQMSYSTRSGSTYGNGGCGSCSEASSVDSLELSDLQSTGSQEGQSSSGRWSDNSMEESHIHDMEAVRREWCETAGTPGGAGQRRSRSSTGGEWVVRRRSDGSRYIGRRRSADKTYSVRDSARQSEPRSTSHQSPDNYDHYHGCARHYSSFDVERKTGDVIHTLTDQRTTMDHEDYSTMEWICSPQWTDSSYRIFAVI